MPMITQILELLDKDIKTALIRIAKEAKPYSL